MIDVTGEEFEWHIRYPGSDGTPGTPDDILTRRHLYLPVGANIRLELHSKDYVYSLALPHLELNEIAVPDLTFIMEFKTEREGTYELLGDQMCGYTHPKLMGEMVVLSKEAFAAWSEKAKAES